MMQDDRELTDDRMQSDREAERQRLRAEYPPTTRESVPDAQPGFPGESGERGATETESMVEGRHASAPNAIDNQGLNPAIEARLAEIQAQFIDDPAAAVRSAESLIQEAVDQMMHNIQSQVEEIRGHTGDGHDTERMRLAMQEYKSMLTRLSI